MNTNPLISVLIPTYNCAKYIAQAIESVVAQNYDNLEIVVVDDGSTDETSAVIKNLTGFQNLLGLSTLKYFRKPHSGISATRNFALEKARGELIAWCDADDYWAAGKLQAQLEYMAEHPDCQVVFTRYENLIENADLTSHTRVIHECRLAETYKAWFTASLAKRELFTDYGGGFSEAHIVNEDTEMIFRWRFKGVDLQHCIDKIFYIRRLHGCNISLDYEMPTDEFIFKEMVIKNIRKKLKK